MEEYITEQLRQAVSELGVSEADMPKLELNQPKQKEHGDLASNVAFLLAKHLRRSPRDIAQMVTGKLNLDSARVAEVNIAGGGFINFSFSKGHLTDVLEEILIQGSNYGKSNIGEGIRTQVEFVSANPTGPLTIGHGRGAVLGDTVARLLQATGFEVIREYYFNDAGRQMRMLGESVRLRYLELLGESVEFPEDHYQGEYIRDIAQLAVNDKGDTLQESDDVNYFKDLAEKTIFQDIEKTLGRMNIHFDEFYNEKTLYETGKIDAVIQTLREKHLAYDSEGAVWFRTTHFGMDQDRVIVKSTGEPTYRLPDIAYHKDKMDRGFDQVIDIFGADHIATYPDVMAGMTALGYDNSKVNVLIHQFVTLTEGKEKIKMSTRKANFITLDELLDEVGPDVARYFFINRSMSSHLNFDLTLAKTRSDENPVFYVQYAHARICSILRHAEKEGIDTDAKADLSLLKAPEELDLIKVLLSFPQVVTDCAQNFEVHRVPSFLEEVAAAYHRFQHAGKLDGSLRVVTDNIPLTQARVALCRATRIVLANGLGLLGISTPEQM